MSLFCMNWLSERDNGEKSEESDKKRREKMP
jgi:hypothetical protein